MPSFYPSLQNVPLCYCTDRMFGGFRPPGKESLFMGWGQSLMGANYIGGGYDPLCPDVGPVVALYPPHQEHSQQRVNQEVCTQIADPAM